MFRHLWKTGKVGFIAAAYVAASYAGNLAVAQNESNDSSQNNQRGLELQEQVRTNPTNADAHTRLAEYYLDIGKYAAAEAEVRAAQRIAGPSENTDALLAWVLYIENKSADLFRNIKPGDRDPLDEATVRMSLGLEHLNSNEFDVAGGLLKDAVRIDPAFARARLALARYFLRTGDIPAARQQMDQASVISPGEIGVERLNGEVLRAAGDTTGAIATFDKIIQSHPTNIPTLLDRADALISADRLSDALSDVQRVAKLGGGPQAIYLSALILARQGNVKDADTALTALVGHFGQSPRGYYLHGVVKYRLGQYGQAQTDFEKAAARDASAAGPVRLNAQIALRQNNPARAIRLLRPFLAANPPDEASIATLARAFIANRQIDEAFEFYQNIKQTGQPKYKSSDLEDVAEIDKIALTPEDVQIAALRAELQNGQVDRVAPLAEALIARIPDEPSAEALLGLVRLAQQRLTDAEAIFRQLLRQHPDLKETNYYLVRVLTLEKKTNEAKSLLQQMAG